MFTRRHKPILIAILFSAVVVGFSYWYTHNKDATSNTDVIVETESDSVIGGKLRGLEPTDHLLGNPNAPIIFYVYSDFSCPFCKTYHETLQSLMRLYGVTGELAIVFRHMPFVQLHPEAPMYALASECVAQEKGSVGFWHFADILFDVADPLEPIGAAEIVLLAEKVGVNRQTFVSCMRSNELMSVVERDFSEVIESGAKGSPFTIVEDSFGRTSFEGAQTFRVLAEAIQATIRTHGIEELAPPSSGSFMDDFDALDTTDSTTIASTTTNHTASSTNKKKQSSILDGIINE